MKIAAIFASIAIGAVAIAPNTTAAPKNGPTVTSIPDGTIPLEIQEYDEPTVDVIGAWRNAPITINWGDGRTSVRRAQNCNKYQATRWPRLCDITASTTYNAPGTYQITVSAGPRQIATSTVTITSPFTANPIPVNPIPVNPTAKVTISGGNTKVNEQDKALPTVTVTGIAADSPIIIDWGNGQMVPHSTACSNTQATQNPASCAITASMRYGAAGTYQVKVNNMRGAVIGSGSITIASAEGVAPVAPVTRTAWKPPAGWVQPEGWSVVGGGATYLPCSTITWHWEENGEPETALELKETAAEALARMSQVTGLKFVETNDRRSAGLTFDWRWPAGNDHNAALGGGQWNTGRAAINFNPNSPILQDQAAGFARKFTWYHEGRSYSTEGNGFTVLHEIGHALGLGHVSNPIELMDTKSRTSGRNEDFGPGTLDGLRTMYSPQTCGAGR